MRDATIVSTARIPIGKAYRGAFNATTPQATAAHAISNAVSVASMSLDRQGAFGMMAIATTAKQVVADFVVGGGGMGAAGLFEVL